MIEKLINIKIKNKDTDRYFVFNGTSILTVHTSEPISEYLEFKKNKFLTRKYDRDSILSKYNFPIYGFKALKYPIKQLSTILENEIPTLHKPSINPKEPDIIKLDNTAFDFIVAYFASKDPVLREEYDYLLDYLLSRIAAITIKIEDEDYYKKTTRKEFRDLPSDNITEKYYRDISVEEALELSNILLRNHYPHCFLRLVPVSDKHSLITFIDNPSKYGIELHVIILGDKQPIWHADSMFTNSVWERNLKKNIFISKIKNRLAKLFNL